MRNGMSWRMGIGLVSALCLGAPGVVPAAETSQQKVMCPICGKANDQNATLSTKAGSTLARGATNTLLGWTELMRQPAEEVKEGGNVLTGMAKGVGETFKRTLSGVGEVLTFWTPKTKNGYIHFAKDCPICMGKQ